VSLNPLNIDLSLLTNKKLTKNLCSLLVQLSINCETGDWLDDIFSTDTKKSSPQLVDACPLYEEKE
jgi:hypothetical protein